MTAEGTRRAREGDAAHGSRLAAIVLVLAAGFALVPRVSAGCEEKLRAHEPAPAFDAALVANAAALPNAAAGDGAAGGVGTKKTLAMADLAGHPVLLDFWATWCGPCQAELPIVNTIASRFKDRGLVVVGVNTSDERSLAEALVKRRGLTFPIVYDEGNDIAHSYHVSSLPTLVVVSKEGKIVAVRRGVTSDAELDRLVREVL